MFYWKGSAYLLITDYYSRYIETAKLRLSSESPSEVICHTKSILARHGIPKEIVSDNGPQYSSLEYKNLVREYKILHTTSSPKYPQSNGKAEKGIRTVKALLKKSDDPYLAMLTYRSTPQQNSFSLAQMLINRHLCTNLPLTDTQLKPCVPDFTTVKLKEDEQNRKQKKVINS